MSVIVIIRPKGDTVEYWNGEAFSPNKHSARFYRLSQFSQCLAKCETLRKTYDDDLINVCYAAYRKRTESN